MSLKFSPDKWARTRAKGMLNYVLKIGVLLWGGLMLAGSTVGALILGKLTTEKFLVAAIVWTLGGAMFGLMSWFLTEREYRKALDGKASGAIE